MQSEHLIDLFRQYLDRTITADGQAELFDYLSTERGRARLPELVDYAYDHAPAAASLDRRDAERIFREITGQRKPHARYALLRRAGAAAALLAIALVSAYLLSDRRDTHGPEHIAAAADIPPGQSRATFTLADGTVIALDSVNTGNVVSDEGIRATNTGGLLTYDVTDQSADQHALQTLATPKGGQYQLVLPDGSHAWLNATSGITFPKGFAREVRRIKVTGEVYLEVAHAAGRDGKRIPFIVELPDGSSVEVLGTRFNINAYEDECGITTTLVEGSVRLMSAGGNASATLVPGMQGVIGKSGAITTAEANIAEAISWKEGKFIFGRADIQSIMRQLARWYDIEVDYPQGFTHTFGGTISRDIPLSQALQTLEMTGGVQFEVKDNRVSVLPGRAK